jgi:serine/threonine-protein kinase
VTQPFGRYRLLEFLASGGMADVYRAEAPGPDGFAKELAIKVLRGDFGAQPEFLEMFKQEARLASRLAHANVVQVFDFGQVEDGRHFIAMELVRGRTLAQVAARCRSLPVPLELGLPRALQICAQVAAALGYAHRRAEGGRPMGLVHRDVSPQNVLISFEGEVKLADFGIARAISSAGVTRPGVVKGKPAYLSPEQARGEEVDGRADLFSLGVVLWELITGFNPFQRESDAATVRAVIGPEPELAPPSRWNPSVPPEFDRLVLSALERDPDRRVASAEELARQLQAILLQLVRAPEDLDLRAFMQRLWPEGATSPGPTRESTQRMPSPGEPAPDGPAPRPAARAWWRWTVAAGGAALLALGIGLTVRWPSPPAAPIAAPAPAIPDPAPATTPAPPPPEEASPQRAQLDHGKPSRQSQPPGRPVRSAPSRPATPRVNVSPSALPATASPAPAGRATLRIFSTSTWAIIYVDGERVGFTPVTRTVTVGKHQIRAEHEDLPPVEETITVEAGEERRWSPQFRTP